MSYAEYRLIIRTLQSARDKELERVEYFLGHKIPENDEVVIDSKMEADRLQKAITSLQNIRRG